MNHPLIKKILPHAIVVALFILIAALYCRQGLQGKILSQHDAIASASETKEIGEYAKKNGEAPLWTNNVFSGMPTYQIWMPANNNLHLVANTIFSIGLPQPMQYFFLCCIMFYFLSQVLRMHTAIGFFASIAFAYCVFNPVIVGAGHITKIWCIAYMPALLAALILLYEKKYLIGFALTALFTCIEIGMNHLQIAYYTFFIIGFMTIGYLIQWIKNKEYLHIIKALGLAVVAGLLGIAVNAVTMLPTADYAKKTIRGGSQQLTDTTNDNSGGVSRSYAFSYSFAPLESFVLFAPHIYGASNGVREFSDDSKSGEALAAMPKQISDQLRGLQTSYWGSLGGTSGPPYVGAVIGILFIFSIFYLQHNYKWWLLGVSAFALLLSWGSNFAIFNNLMYDYFPLYNKFRAPSMTFVILQCVWPILAGLTLQQFVIAKVQPTKPLLYGAIGVGVLLLILSYLNLNFDYTDESIVALRKQIQGIDTGTKEYIDTAINGLISDRQEMFKNDILKFFGIALVILGIGYMYVKKIVTEKYIIIAAFTVLLMVDLLSVGSKYMNLKPNGADAFTNKDVAEINATANKANIEIMKDTSWYRVLNVSEGNPFNDAPTSAYHKSVGGYHAAKLAIYQDVIENKLQGEMQDIMERIQAKDTGLINGLNPSRYTSLAMLGTKYLILNNPPIDAKEQPSILTNNNTKGNVWFVQNVKLVQTDKECMDALNGLNPYSTSVIYSKDAKLVQPDSSVNSTATIQLVANKNNTITYKSNSNTAQFAVCSEVYYDAGWYAYIDGKQTPIIRTNYTLRGVQVPAGGHSIEFRFEPRSYAIGRSITTVAQLLILLVLAFAIFWEVKNYKKSMPLKATS